MNGWLGVIRHVIYSYQLSKDSFGACTFILRNGYLEPATVDIPISKCYTMYQGQRLDLPTYYESDLDWIKDNCKVLKKNSRDVRVDSVKV